MEKIRATAFIREYLLRQVMMNCIKRDAEKIKEFPKESQWMLDLLRSMYDEIHAEKRSIKRELMNNAVFIIEEEWREIDIFMHYKENGYIKEAVYMMAMLDAEAYGRLELYWKR